MTGTPNAFRAPAMVANVTKLTDGSILGRQPAYDRWRMCLGQGGRECAEIGNR